jgi:hypothetical protein
MVQCCDICLHGPSESIGIDSTIHIAAAHVIRILVEPGSLGKLKRFSARVNLASAETCDRPTSISPRGSVPAPSSGGRDKGLDALKIIAPGSGRI